ncbi:MAG: peptide ligase PGM1-related protein [Acidobacteriota bacterium]
MDPNSQPNPGSPEEIWIFNQLQAKLPLQFQRLFENPKKPRTIVVVPSLTLDQEELTKIEGAHHYEERMLCMLMLLRMPRTRVIYVTSQPVHSMVIDYFLHQLPGIPFSHARSRLELLSCHDASPAPLTLKILRRPRLLQRIRERIIDVDSSHLSAFNVTHLERTLAVRLGIPIYGCDPELGWLGEKSGCRKVFREAGVQLPRGFEDLRDEGDIFDALTDLKTTNPKLRRAVVKLNEGFSGEGNALLSFEGCPEKDGVRAWIAENLPKRLRFEAKTETWPAFRRKFEQMRGIVEEFIEGKGKTSPSVQCRIDPAGNPHIISTHDQVLGGPTGQIFLGCNFPAHDDYRLQIQEAGMDIARVLCNYRVLGRFGIDFICVPKPDGSWESYAIEINLRKGGTTHPFMMLQFLTHGEFDEETGLYRSPSGQPRYYVASDNLSNARYQGLTPRDLIDIAVLYDLHFNGANQQGVIFHLIGALSEFGKLGVMCIGDSHDNARQLYEETVEDLDFEAERQDHLRGETRRFDGRRFTAAAGEG